MSVAHQIDLAIGRYGRFIAAAMVILALVAFAGAATTYLNPPVEEITEQTEQQTVRTDVGTTALVANGTALYDEGQVLRGMPVYFFEASPVMTLRVRVDVPSGQEVTVTQRHVIYLRATRNGETFYEDRRVVATDRSRVSDGTVWSNSTMDMRDIRSYVSEKQSAVSGVGSLSVTLRTNVAYETNQYSGTFNTSAPLVFSGEGYWIDGDLSASRTHGTPVTRRSVGSPDMTRVGGLSLLGIGLLAGATAVLARSRRIDPVSVETDLVRSRYDEWISNGEIPTKTQKDYIRTDSLEDLVDVAIDSSSRVIYDRNLDAYATVEGDIVYYFVTDETELTEWFDV
jgi:hypothetical protein